MSNNLQQFSYMGSGALSQRVRVSTPGKVIIIGEHAVVYGAKAVALPLDAMKIDLCIEKYSTNTTNKLEPKDHKDDLSQVLSLLLEDALKLFGIPQFLFSLKGYSNILIGAGLGSSASLCVLVIKAISSLFQISLTSKELAYYSNILEKRFHGLPSGLDTSVIAYNEMVIFSKSQGATPIPLQKNSPNDLPWSFVLIDSQERSATVEMIHKASPFFQNNLDEKIKLFDFLAEEVVSGFKDNNHSQVGCAMNRTNSLLAQMGVITNKMEEIVSTLQNLDALGAKITGAGGGGCVLGLLDPLRASEQKIKLQQHFPNRVYGFDIRPQTSKEGF